MHIPRPDALQPVTPLADPASAPLRLLDVRLLRLAPGDAPVTLDTGPREAVLDLLGGKCALEVDGPAGRASWDTLGERADPFDGLPTMVYVPRSSRLTVTATDGPCEALLALAPARADHPVRVVVPHEAEVKTVGRGNWQRRVATSIGDAVEADALIVGETLNPPGNWSSSPPHKHDRASATEAPMEEVYHYRLSPPQGFGLQRIYTAPGDPEPIDVTYAVRDGDTVAIPRGYHPVVAAAGYGLLYVWILAGSERRYGAWSDDPEHAWVKDAG